MMTYSNADPMLMDNMSWSLRKKRGNGCCTGLISKDNDGMLVRSFSPSDCSRFRYETSYLSAAEIGPNLLC